MDKHFWVERQDVDGRVVGASRITGRKAALNAAALTVRRGPVTVRDEAGDVIFARYAASHSKVKAR